MATNEILQFASTNTGTNLLTQAEYSADAQRTTGNQPGIARSKLVNKALRQSSLLAAGLAEFIADYQANNVTDSLTPQNVADYLLAAIQANIPVVPDASTTTKGKVQLATAAEAQALSDALKALTPSTLNQSLKGSNQSLSTNGYQKLPGGLIVQWGYLYNVSISETWYQVTLPVAYPNANLFVDVQIEYLTYAFINGANGTGVIDMNTTGMKISADHSSQVLNGSLRWFSVGF